MLYTAYDARKQRRFAHLEGIVGRTGLALLQKRGSAIDTYLEGDLGAQIAAMLPISSNRIGWNWRRVLLTDLAKEIG